MSQEGAVSYERGTPVTQVPADLTWFKYYSKDPGAARPARFCIEGSRLGVCGVGFRVEGAGFMV